MVDQILSLTTTKFLTCSHMKRVCEERLTKSGRSIAQDNHNNQKPGDPKRGQQRRGLRTGVPGPSSRRFHVNLHGAPLVLALLLQTVGRPQGLAAAPAPLPLPCCYSLVFKLQPATRGRHSQRRRSEATSARTSDSSEKQRGITLCCAELGSLATE